MRKAGRCHENPQSATSILHFPVCEICARELTSLVFMIFRVLDRRLSQLERPAFWFEWLIFWLAFTVISVRVR